MGVGIEKFLMSTMINFMKGTCVLQASILDVTFEIVLEPYKFFYNRKGLIHRFYRIYGSFKNVAEYSRVELALATCAIFGKKNYIIDKYSLSSF